MTTPVFTGACPAIVTPFTDTGSIHYSCLAHLIEMQIDGGSQGICIAGTTGEASTLSTEEHVDLVAFTAKQINGRVPLIAGAGKNSTVDAIEMSHKLECVGADALLHVTPYYNKASQAGLLKHFEAIDEGTHVPIILYNVPGRTGLSFTADTYYALSKRPGIVGVKEASGDFPLVLETIDKCGPDFHIWTGNDDQIVPMMALGAKGSISVLSNIAPSVVSELTSLCLSNCFSQAKDLQIKYNSLISALFMEVNPIPVKAAMNLMDLDVGGLRLPLDSLTPTLLPRLTAALKACELL